MARHSHLTLASPIQGMHTARPAIVTTAGRGAVMRTGDMLIEAFCAWQIGRAFSAATVRRRATTIRSFGKHIRPAELTEATGPMVEDFLALHHSPRTKRAYRSDLSSFYRWATKRDLAPTNPVLATDSIRVPRSLPRPVPPEMVPWIINNAPDDRTRLIIALAAYAGLRVSEISALTADDVTFYPQPMLTVRHGKGGKDRTIPIADALAPLLRQRRGRFVPLTADRIGKIGAAHLRACGFDCTTHQLRHSFGTEMYRITKDLKKVGRLMGHESTQTTEGYAALTDDSAHEAINLAYQPRTLRSAS